MYETPILSPSKTDGTNELLEFLIRVDRLFPVPLSEKTKLCDLERKLSNFGTLGIVRQNGKIVSLCAGYANDYLNFLAYISVVASLPEYSGKGYGKIAVSEFIEKAKRAGMRAVHLYVVKENIPAVKLYERLGFVDYIVENEPRPEDRHLILYL